MSGGTAFVLDPDGGLPARCNTGSVALEPPGDADEPLVRDLLERHLAATASAVAERLLDTWPESLAAFVKVMPNDLRRLLEAGGAASGGRMLEPVGA
jgi:glutamate synthase (NADPH) large chain